ncbi:MAG: VOC family protein [Saprospiraceae bacterium]|nr:VOC family protein [Saprospiraceae bacterium]
MTKPIYPCLWFNTEAQEAAKFYCSVFKNSKVVSSDTMTTIFEINGTKFMGLNGGPEFSFSEAVSFVEECETQEEIDHCWNMLTTNGGQEENCGWLKDKYGVSWQIVPTILSKLLSDPEKIKRIMPIFRSIKKFNINELINA